MSAHTCRCGSAWTGRNTAHCGGCHRTFGAVSLFDAHRVNHTCRDPEALRIVAAPGKRMVLDDRGIWRDARQRPRPPHWRTEGETA